MEDNVPLICPIFKSLSRWRRVGHKKIIQNSNFKYGIKIINKNKKKFSNGFIKNVEIIPVEDNINFKIVSDKIYPIESLSFEDIQEIWFDKAKSSLPGCFKLSFELEIEDNVIRFSDLYFNIISEESFNQKITNILLVILTILMLGMSACSFIISIFYPF